MIRRWQRDSSCRWRLYSWHLVPDHPGTCSGQRSMARNLFPSLLPPFFDAIILGNSTIAHCSYLPHKSPIATHHRLGVVRPDTVTCRVIRFVPKLNRSVGCKMKNCASRQYDSWVSCPSCHCLVTLFHPLVKHGVKHSSRTIVAPISPLSTSNAIRTGLFYTQRRGFVYRLVLFPKKYMNHARILYSIQVRIHEVSLRLNCITCSADDWNSYETGSIYKNLRTKFGRCV